MEGVDAPVLASVKIAKNAQLVAVIKYINFGMEEALRGALSSIKYCIIFENLAISFFKLVPPFIVSLGYNKSLSIFLKITPSALGALGRRFESCRPDQSETGFPAYLFIA